MEAIRAQMQRPVVVGLVALVLGLILGIVYGWVIDPVEWTDASIRHLRADLKEDYLRMAIDDYARTQNAGRALARWEEMQPGAEEILAAVELNPGEQNQQAIAAFRQIVTATVPGEGEAEAGGNLLMTLLPALCVVTLLFGAGVVGVLYLRSRGSSGGAMPRTTTAAEQAAAAAETMQRTDYAAIGEEPPVGQFMTTYMLGDDLYDDSFSIDSPTGEFLGECGVGISETIGVGDPKRVTAFEVWLFDKDDIQTVTKVLMSQHAYDNPETRAKLAAKGEPVLARPGTPIMLETRSLRLVARVVDQVYGDGMLPPDSFFERITLELAVWPMGE